MTVLIDWFTDISTLETQKLDVDQISSVLPSIIYVGEIRSPWKFTVHFVCFFFFFFFFAENQWRILIQQLSTDM